MRSVIKIGAVLVAASMLFAACGNPMVSLTEDEENVVVNYSAGILAKHNNNQQEGMTAIYPQEEELEEPKEEEPEEDKEEPKEEEPKEDKEEPKEEEPEEPKEDSDEAEGQMTLTEALSVSGIEFSYHDCSTSDNYRQGDVFSLDASEGNVLLMLNINMTNTGSKAVDCDLLSKQISYSVSLNGGSAIPNQTTMLTNDMSTYRGTLEPGQTEAVVLLFDVPENAASDLSSLQLSVRMDGAVNRIIL